MCRPASSLREGQERHSVRSAKGGGYDFCVFHSQEAGPVGHTGRAGGGG